MKWQCRWSPTLGSLEGTHQQVWGTDEYTDQERPTVFFGMYSFADFEVLWHHKGIKEILWCGSDITRFIDGFWLEDGGKTKLPAIALVPWLKKNCDHWVENEVEMRELETVGIYPRVCPSFLGNIDDFEVSFSPGNKLYTSVSGDEFKLYGWDKIYDIAEANPDVEFHLYGNKKDYYTGFFKNVIKHGKVPREQMNEEIKKMQGAMRLTLFDGFSEVISKAMLWGQYAFSYIQYPHVNLISEIGTILEKTEPNNKGREHYRKHLNQFPWNVNL